MLAASQQYQAPRWLLDVRRRPVPPAGATQWLVAEWLPQVAAQLPGRLRIAYLLSSLRTEALRTDVAQLPVVQELLAPH